MKNTVPTNYPTLVQLYLKVDANTLGLFPTVFTVHHFRTWAYSVQYSLYNMLHIRLIMHSIIYRIVTRLMVIGRS